MLRLAALGLTAALAAEPAGGQTTPTPTVTPFAVPGDPTCGQFAVLSCPTFSTSASLTRADCLLSDGSYADWFRFSGTQGQTVTIDLSSAAFDSYLFLLNPVGEVVDDDDDSGGGLNSRLTFTLASTGTWTVVANSFHPNSFGPYLLSLSCAGGVGLTATPLSGAPPPDIPTLSFPALLLLMALLTGTGFFLLRRG